MWGEENSLEMYVRNSWDVLLQGVRITGEIESGETVSKDELKTSWNNDMKLDSWIGIEIELGQSDNLALFISRRRRV